MYTNLTKQQKNASIFIFVISLLFFIQACQPKPDPKVAKKIADHLGIDPTWEDIQDYLYNFLEPGKKREEIHDLLNQIGPYTIINSDLPNELQWDPDTKKYVLYETIRFDEENTYKALFEWYFLYDTEDKLVLGYKIDPY